MNDSNAKAPNFLIILADGKHLGDVFPMET